MKSEIQVFFRMTLTMFTTACVALEGVSIANTRNERKCELDKALDDVEAGRVTMYESPEALFNDFGI